MLKKLLLLAALAASPALAQSVQQSGTVTHGHVPVWNTSGVVGDGGSSADSPITSLGVTNNGGAGFCVSSDRQSAAGRNQLCFGASTTGPATISVQNYGTATAQGINYVINGTTVSIPTGGGTFIFGNAPFNTGNVPCFLNSFGLVQDCGLSLNAGVVTSGIWHGTSIDIAYGGTGASTGAAARTNLGLGSMALQNSTNISVTGGTITGMPTPTVSSDVAIKSYVDATASGLNILAPSKLATATILPNTPTYSNGTLGVGATLTAGSNTTLTVDSTTANLNDVVLVKDQVSAFQNGIYTVTQAGSGAAPWILTRATYFDQAAEMKAGSYTFVSAGVVNTGSSFTLQGAVTTVGTDPLTFVQFSASAVGTVTSVGITAGSGISATGTCTITSSGICNVANTGVLSFNSRTGAVTPGSSDYISSQIGFTQVGTGATAITLDTLLHNKVFTPEMFGAVCSPNGTAVGSIADSSAAIQAAINQAAAVFGTVQFGPCAYKTTLVQNITSGNVMLRGSGVNQTTIVWQPVSPSPAFFFSAGASILSNVGITDLSILSGDTTTTKIGILMEDVSEPIISNINIAHYPIDGTLFRGGSGSIGIQIAGRELGKVSNVEIYAEQPIQISANANAPNTGEDMDSWVWRDLLLVGQLSGAARHVILVDNSVSFYNTHFEGHQNWIGGVDGFHYVQSGGTTVSEGLYISGVKDEQAGASGGYTFNIQAAAAAPLYNLDVSDSSPGVRNAFFLRNVTNASIRDVLYDANTSATKVGMNADLSNSIIDFHACIWITGTTASLGAFSTSGVIHPTGFSAALPASGVLYH